MTSQSHHYHTHIKAAISMWGAGKNMQWRDGKKGRKQLTTAVLACSAPCHFENYHGTLCGTVCVISQYILHHFMISLLCYAVLQQYKACTRLILLADLLLACVCVPVCVRPEPARRYRLLEIELDAVYRSMLLLKKKKYAAVKVRPAHQCPNPTSVQHQVLCYKLCQSTPDYAHRVPSGAASRADSIAVLLDKFAQPACSSQSIHPWALNP